MKASSTKRALAGCGKTYLLMRSLPAPCDKAGFVSLVLPLWDITERESRVRKAFFRSLLVDGFVGKAGDKVGLSTTRLPVHTGDSLYESPASQFCQREISHRNRHL